jgi:hypothetical protein
MANIFSSLRTYAGKWEVKSSRSFTAEEIAAVKSNVIVSSQYGNSLCFFMKNGGMTYIPMSTNASAGIGESVDLTKVRLLTLGKEGESDIYRIED